jgi:uncharacterized caspase-like protein
MASWAGDAKGKLYYIGFGVSQYRDSSLDLRYADKDARDLAEYFRSVGTAGGASTVVHVWTNAEVTREAITRAREIVQAGSADDTLVLFISGHGMHERTAAATYYYLTSEADLSNLGGTCASFDLVEGILMAAPMRKKLFLMDTCASGDLDTATDAAYADAAAGQGITSRAPKERGITTVKAAPPARPWLLQTDRFIYNNLARRSGAIVYSSCQGTEYSYEWDAIGNGIFTQMLLQGLSEGRADADGNGRVTVPELRTYVTPEVARQTGNLQHPTIDRDNLYVTFSFPVTARR